MSNAIKFTPEGGRVTVRIVNDEKEEELITVEVKDTGIGIAEEHKSHLFSVRLIAHAHSHTAHRTQC